MSDGPNIATLWTQHCGRDEEAKQKTKQMVLSSRATLKLLSEVLKRKEEASERLTLRVEDFDSPSWAYKQAYLNGRQSAINEILELIILDKQETK